MQEFPAEVFTKRTEEAIEGKGRAKSPTKSVATFVLHQFIGMCGIPYTAPVVFSLFFKCLALFGHTYPRKTFYSIVTLPYFPVQIVFALILGWLLGRALRQRSIVWVWVLPLITMPFYSCLAYSLGAAFAKKAFGYADSKSGGHFRAVTIAGFLVVAAFLIDLIVSVQQVGWHGTYLFLALTPTVVGALLLYVGLKMRPQPVSTA